MRAVKEKKERALGTKLFLKADRCNSPKCVMVRRPHRPGMHGAARHTVSEFGRQLQEKQKIQLIYGLTNRQMQRLFKTPPEKVLPHLESRLDRVVFLLGLVKSSRIARQVVSHGHIFVNGRKVTIPSYSVTMGDIVSVRPESKKDRMFEDTELRLKGYVPPAWLTVNAAELSGKCVSLPKLEDYGFPFDINLVAQFYSR